MAWTANVTASDESWVYLEFLEDGTRKFAEKYRRPATTQALQLLVRNEIARLSGVATITPGAVTPASADPVDPDLTLKEQFLAQLATIRQLDKAIAFPVTTGANLTTLTSARSSALTALQNFYNAQTPAVRQKIVDIL